MRDSYRAEIARWPWVLALGLTLAVVAGLAAFAVYAHWYAQQNHQRTQRLEVLRGQILRYDESLTLAARMGADTGAFRWQRRYSGDEARLERALDAAVATAPSLAETRALRQTRQANRELVALERRAFALARTGRSQSARTLLVSTPYREAKAAYAAGMEQLRQHLHEKKSALLGRVGEGIYRLFALGGAGLLLLLGAWGTVFRTFYRNRDRQARYREQLLASLGEGVFGVDRQGHFTFFNPAARELFGFASEEAVIGRNSHQLTHHNDAEGAPYPEAECPIYQVMATGRPLEAWRDRFWRADGASFPVEVSASPFGPSGGPATGAVVVFRDITEEQERERVLQTYRAVFDQSRDAVMLLDRGRFLDPNPATLRLFRVADEAAFTGYHPADLSPARQPDGRPSSEVAQERIEEAFSQGQAFFEWCHCTVDAEEFPAEVFLSRIDLAEGSVLQALVRDISERKAMERSLQRYRAAFEQSRDAVMFLDRGNYIEGNPATLTMFGVDSNEAFRAYHPADFSPPFQPDGRPSSEAAQARIQEAFDRGQSFFEWQHSTRDGKNFPTEVLLSRVEHGEQAMLQVVVRDISERKAVEVARDRVLAILDATPDLVAMADREGRVTYINRGGLLLLGEDPESTGLGAGLPEWMVQEGARALPHPEWARRRIQEEGLPAAEREGVWRGEVAVFDGEGWEIPVSQVILAHRDDTGKVTRFSTVMRDLSAQKRTEAKLRERVKELSTLRDVILFTTDDERSLRALLDACAKRLPAGWEASERTAARIRAGGLEAVSEPFFETGTRQHTAIDDPEAPVEVEVFRSGDDASDAFLSEEQELLESVAQQIRNALLRRQAQQELERLATHDRLTGIPNRARLYELLEGAWLEHERYGTPFSVIMLDIDHFKAVNDRYGHQAGDEVLRELSRRVDDALRETDAVGRWGGEEFLVLATHAGAEEAAELAERLRARVARTPFEGVGSVTISLGVAAHASGETMESLEGRVDNALYAAKEAGRDRVTMAEAPIQET